MIYREKTKIAAWLDKYKIKNYTIIEDVVYGYAVDVFGSVFLTGKELEEIKVKFNVIDGDFGCSYNQLTTLEGAPRSVRKDFFCSENQLTSLQGGPTSVGVGFYCHQNRLTSLLGAPQSIGKDFDCSNNKLISLEYCPRSVVGYFDCKHNSLTTLQYLPETVGGLFHCNYNEGLGKYQIIEDFKKIKDMSTSDREKLLLSALVQNSTKTNRTKL